MAMMPSSPPRLGSAAPQIHWERAKGSQGGQQNTRPWSASRMHLLRMADAAKQDPAAPQSAHGELCARKRAQHEQRQGAPFMDLTNPMASAATVAPRCLRPSSARVGRNSPAVPSSSQPATQPQRAPRPQSAPARHARMVQVMEAADGAAEGTGAVPLTPKQLLGASQGRTVLACGREGVNRPFSASRVPCVRVRISSATRRRGVPAEHFVHGY